MSSQNLPQVSVQSGVTVISLGPEYENLDEHLLEDLRTSILEVTNNAEPPLVVLDLSHTKFFGSAFIEILFRAWNRMNAKDGGKFVISGLTSYCREVIEVTNLDKLWDLYETCDDAVTALTKSAV